MISQEDRDVLNNPQKVYNFLKANPKKFYCDDCVERATTVDRHQIHTIARAVSRRVSQDVDGLFSALQQSR